MKDVGLVQPTIFNPKMRDIAEKIKQKRGGMDAFKHFACASVKYATKIQISKQLKLNTGTIRRALHTNGQRRHLGRGKMSINMRQKITAFYLREDISGVSWPSDLAYRTQVLVLAAECGFESRP